MPLSSTGAVRQSGSNPDLECLGSYMGRSVRGAHKLGAVPDNVRGHVGVGYRMTSSDVQGVQR